jgi:hypothetical protein
MSTELDCVMATKKETGSTVEQALAEVTQMEQASKDMDQDIQKLVLKLKEKEAAFYSARKSLDVKARTLIDKAKDECEILLQDATKKAEAILAGAVEETKKWEAEKELISKVQRFEPSVKLDVGGVRYTTSLKTLRRFPDTMIGCMFSGRHALPVGEDGYFFIDRDGKHFQNILNFLRSPEGYKVEVKGKDVGELRRECSFYGIDEVMVSEKNLMYFNACSESCGKIDLRVDGGGVHTILDSKEKIEYCPNCHRGLFMIGEVQFFFKGFDAQSLPAAQPLVEGPCPRCRK